MKFEEKLIYKGISEEFLKIIDKWKDEYKKIETKYKNVERELLRRDKIIEKLLKG